MNKNSDSYEPLSSVEKNNVLQDVANYFKALDKQEVQSTKNNKQ